MMPLFRLFRVYSGRIIECAKLWCHSALSFSPLYSRTFTAENAEHAEKRSYDRIQTLLDQQCVSVAESAVSRNSKALAVLCELCGLGGE